MYNIAKLSHPTQQYLPFDYRCLIKSTTEHAQRKVRHLTLLLHKQVRTVDLTQTCDQRNGYQTIKREEEILLHFIM